MDNYPKISIITPSYNQGQFIEETIKSVVIQDYPNIEYIIIDGGSTDNTLDIIKKYAKKYKFIKWISEKDKGQSDAINKGLRMAKGDILTWLNSDDVFVPGTVMYIAKIFKKNKKIDLIYGNIKHINEKGKAVAIEKGEIFNFNKALNNKNLIPQPGCFFKSKKIKEVGFLDKSLKYAMDYDLWLKLYRSGARFYYTDKTLALFRMHQKSKSGLEMIKFVPEVFRVSRKYGGKLFSPQNKKLFSFFIKTYILKVKIYAKKTIDFSNKK